jgi:hypothetical protein
MDMERYYDWEIRVCKEIGGEYEIQRWEYEEYDDDFEEEVIDDLIYEKAMDINSTILASFEAHFYKKVMTGILRKIHNHNQDFVLLCDSFIEFHKDYIIKCAKMNLDSKTIKEVIVGLHMKILNITEEFINKIEAEEKEQEWKEKKIKARAKKKARPFVTS